MANLSKTTQDHDEIRRWAEERGAHPSCVKGTGNEGDIGLLRLDFPGYSGEQSLQEIGWEDFFEKFDEQNLALLYQEETAEGERSNFNKLVSAETAEEVESGSHKKGGAKKSTGGSKKAASRGSAGSSSKRASVGGGTTKKAASAKKTASKSTASKSASKKAPLKKASGKSGSGKKAVAKKAPAKKVLAKKTSAKNAASKTAPKKSGSHAKKTSKGRR